MNKDITDITINFLNELLKLDPSLVHHLMEFRVCCNQEIAEHPTVQVKEALDGELSVNFFGILNGLLGKIGADLVAYQHDQLTDEQYGYIKGFCRYNP